jgi:hypothetical protein
MSDPTVEMLVSALRKVMQGDQLPREAQEFLDGIEKQSTSPVLLDEFMRAAIRYFKYHSGG